jgi:HAD superfamily hydrolase (TIGR01484 family)
LDSRKTIRSDVKDVLGRLQSEGVFITFITGRSNGSAEPYARELQVQIPFGLIHGALVRNLFGMEIRKRVIPPAGVQEALDLGARHDCVPILVTSSEMDALTFCDIHREHPIARLPLSQIQESPETRQLVRFLEQGAPFDSAYTIYLIGRNEAIDNLIAEHVAQPARMSQVTKVPVHGFEAEPEFIRSHSVAMFSPVGADKRTALEAIAETLGIPMSQVAAFGDWHNDLPMLSAAGYAVVMGNAPKDLLAGLHHPRLIRTGTNDSTGIVDALARLGLV